MLLFLNGESSSSSSSSWRKTREGVVIRGIELERWTLCSPGQGEKETLFIIYPCSPSQNKISQQREGVAAGNTPAMPVPVGRCWQLLYMTSFLEGDLCLRLTLCLRPSLRVGRLRNTSVTSWSSMVVKFPNTDLIVGGVTEPDWLVSCWLTSAEEIGTYPYQQYKQRQL